MESEQKEKNISRRFFLGASILTPFLSSAESFPQKKTDAEDHEFTTLLTAHGGVVKVKKSALKKAKVIEKKMSNKSLLHWLKLK